MQPQTALGHYLATRSAIPRVVGILAILFACVGLGSTGLWVWGPLDDLGRWGRHSGLPAWLWTWGALSLVVSVLHFAGGLSAMFYRRRAPRLLTAYAIGAIAVAAADVIVLLAVAPSTGSHHWRISDSVLIPHFIYSGVAWMWPTLVLILMNVHSAKSACFDNPS